MTTITTYEVENYSLGTGTVQAFSNEDEADKFAEAITRETGHTHIVNSVRR